MSMISVEEAERALARAREAEQQAEREAQAKAEAAAQAAFDREQAKVIDAVEREVADTIAAAAKLAATSPIERGASAACRGFLVGELVASPLKSRLVQATELDGPATSLRNAFERVQGLHNRLTTHRPNGTRAIGAENRERLSVLERKLWGVLIRRMRVLSGEEV
jgi:hypothetical protein